MSIKKPISTAALMILADALQRTVDARAQRAAVQVERDLATERLAVAFGAPVETDITLELTT